jgi:hypothetical protein
MRIEFKPEELEWLDKAVTVAQKLTARDPSPESAKVNRVVSKMKSKFAGAPHVVFLTGKERALLGELATMRAEALQGRGTDEAIAVRGILETLLHAAGAN